MTTLNDLATGHGCDANIVAGAATSYPPDFPIHIPFISWCAGFLFDTLLMNNHLIPAVLTALGWAVLLILAGDLAVTRLPLLRKIFLPGIGNFFEAWYKCIRRNVEDLLREDDKRNPPA